MRNDLPIIGLVHFIQDASLFNAMRSCLPTILGAELRTGTFVCFLTYLTKQVVIYLIVLVTGILICTSLGGFDTVTLLEVSILQQVQEVGRYFGFDTAALRKYLYLFVKIFTAQVPQEEVQASQG